MNIKNMAFAELRQAISDYIYYYNNVIVQEKLGWMNPTQIENQL
ncbi:IS3 family transposase [bacterium]|nr:IS3 family transposase [bacterium]